ncbi:MAG: type II toxin-antitoxin system VapB family antitoxin [Kiritimatiellae bacterium]|nr:type II toxin-antitoxin system VapB family antitoxin [Kiritimatiellia bacterium]
MLVCMRTTIQLNDELLRRAKSWAVEQHCTFTALVENALRAWLDSRAANREGRRVKIPTSGSGGVLAGVDLDCTASLLERMEGRS